MFSETWRNTVEKITSSSDDTLVVNILDVWQVCVSGVSCRTHVKVSFRANIETIPEVFTHLWSRDLAGEQRNTNQKLSSTCKDPSQQSLEKLPRLPADTRHDTENIGFRFVWFTLVWYSRTLESFPTVLCEAFYVFLVLSSFAYSVELSEFDPTKLRALLCAIHLHVPSGNATFHSSDGESQMKAVEMSLDWFKSKSFAIVTEAWGVFFQKVRVVSFGIEC